MRRNRVLIMSLCAALTALVALFGSLAAASDGGGGSELKVPLTGAAINGVIPEGSADFRLRNDGSRRLNVEVEDVNLPTGTILSVLVDASKVGEIIVNAVHAGELELNTNDGNTVPPINSGSKVVVNNAAGATILAGAFSTMPTPSPTPSPSPTASPSPSPSPSASPTPSPSPKAGASTIQFAAQKFRVSVSTSGSITITVTRAGSTAGTATVDFSLGKDDDGSDTARQQTDFTLTAGTLTFAPGETAQTFVVLINKVVVPVAAEKEAKLVLSNVKGNATLGNPSQAELEIEDDDVAVEARNPIDDHGNFVVQHYHDFLNRDPETGGLLYWKQKLDDCGADASCLAQARRDISAAFYISREFQDTGFFVFKMEKVAFNQRPQYSTFIPEVQQISREMLEQNLDASRRDFTEGFVDRPEFHQAFDAMSNDRFVDQLYRNAEVVPDAATRN